MQHVKFFVSVFLNIMDCYHILKTKMYEARLRAAEEEEKRRNNPAYHMTEDEIKAHNERDLVYVIISSSGIINQCE